VDSGAYLISRITELGKKYPDWIANVRGRGLCQAFDVENVEKRGALIKKLKLNGVNAPICGVATIRARPCLYWTNKHSDVYIGRLEKSIKELM
jgi:4-aminobutyrate aminotransferase-like enzyme